MHMTRPDTICSHIIIVLQFLMKKEDYIHLKAKILSNSITLQTLFALPPCPRPPMIGNISFSILNFFIELHQIAMNSTWHFPPYSPTRLLAFSFQKHFFSVNTSITEARQRTRCTTNKAKHHCWALSLSYHNVPDCAQKRPCPHFP